MSKSLTIVLPVYNAELRLRKNVTELLELASELTPKFGVLIIDDGSTDDTFEVAEDLAAHYPQVLVRRHRHRRGLGAAIEYVQRRVRSDAVMVHDGVTPVNPQQMRSVWQSWISDSAPAKGLSAATLSAGAMHDAAHLSAVHTVMENAHRRVIGFQLITQDQSSAAASEGTPATSKPQPRSDAPRPKPTEGIGQIPALPRPKFLSALANFAFGE